jgi:hypothetical protein
MTEDKPVRIFIRYSEQYRLAEMCRTGVESVIEDKEFLLADIPEADRAEVMNNCTRHNVGLYMIRFIRPMVSLWTVFWYLDAGESRPLIYADNITNADQILPAIRKSLREAGRA